VTRAPVDLSLVVPALDDAHRIAPTLASLVPLGRPDREIIVADGGSTDGTADVAFDALGGAGVVFESETRLTPAELQRAAPHLATGRTVAVVSPGSMVACRGDEATGLPAGVLREARTTATASSGAPGALPAADWRRLRDVEATGIDAEASPVYLMPGVGYHTVELNALADELERRGIPSAYLFIDGRWEALLPGLRRTTVPVHRRPEDPAVLAGARAMVTMNDWGDFRPEIEEGNRRGIPTFGKVEGVQDWDDVDVRVKRSAYRTVRHVLCQGTNDARAAGPERSTIVGSTRLERIWLEDRPSSDEGFAVINVNFTYNVLDEVRRGWLDAAVAACRREGIDYAISMHPAERASVEDPNVSDAPMAHLLTRASLLISRFSTVPFEAMARGVPFVYFNPHDEQVPAFASPEGAFKVARSSRRLRRAIRRSLPLAGRQYRASAEGFFRDQVDIEPGRSAAERTADAIAAHVVL
jgi:hypothetical protein